MDNPETLAI